MGIDADKCRELMLYLANRSQEDPGFSLTKLNKLFYFIDKESWLKTRRTITGAMYIRLQFGPVPDGLDRTVRAPLEQSGEAELVSVPYHGYEQQRLVARRAPDTTVFTDAELALVDEVVTRLWGQNATRVSDLSHEDPGWQMVSDRAEIPHEAWLLDNEPTTLTGDDIQWARRAVGA